MDHWGLAAAQHGSSSPLPVQPAKPWRACETDRTSLSQFSPMPLQQEVGRKHGLRTLLSKCQDYLLPSPPRVFIFWPHDLHTASHLLVFFPSLLTAIADRAVIGTNNLSCQRSFSAGLGLMCPTVLLCTQACFVSQD